MNDIFHGQAKVNDKVITKISNLFSIQY